MDDISDFECGKDISPINISNSFIKKELGFKLNYSSKLFEITLQEKPFLLKILIEPDWVWNSFKKFEQNC